MKISGVQNGYMYQTETAKMTENQQVAKENEDLDTVEALDEEETIFPSLSSEEDPGWLEKLLNLEKTKGTFKFSTSKPEDDSRKLTQRLVSAGGQFEVRQVISDANKSLVNLRMIAAVATGDDAKAAREYVAKLEKVLLRANKKIKALDKEDGMKLEKVRAQQEKKTERAREIKTELRKKQQKRKSEEQGYLYEEIGQSLFGKRGSSEVSEMELDRLANAMAAAEIAAEEFGSVEIGSGDGGSSASTQTEGSTVEAEAPAAEVE